MRANVPLPFMKPVMHWLLYTLTVCSPLLCGILSVTNVSLYVGALPVHKATIMPRGPALGLVAQLPEKDELLLSKKQLLAKMDVAMAGRVAEELIFGNDNVTTGNVPTVCTQTPYS